MKKILLILFLLLTALAGIGQNLVPNGDFEQYSGCPNDFSQIDSALFWINPSDHVGTPDYYNQCSNSFNVDVPNNFWGYQPARSGNAYSGIFIWVTWGQVREYIEAPLTTTLIANNCYHFEMYLNLPDECQYTADAISIYFTDTAVTGINNFDPLPFTPQINNTSGNIQDTLNWVLVSGNYTASGGENYLIIGNYKDDLSTNPVIINNLGSWQGAYFFIDDVSLTPCTGIEEQNNEAITIYPNPVTNELKIQNAGLKIKEIKIYDVMGKEILRKQFNLQSSIFNLQSFQKGIYFIEINTGKDIFRKKFIKE